MTQSGASFNMAEWARGVKQSELQRLLESSADPKIISFALGLPDPDLFPVSEFGHACEKALCGTPSALQYGVPEHALKEHIASLMMARGVDCSADQIFLTAGAQQGISLLSRLLAVKGQSVVVDEFCYPGFLQILEPLGLLPVPVPSDPYWGIDVDQLEKRLQSDQSIAFIYLVAEGNNPLGYSIPPSRRAQLISVARKYKVPIIEDDAYGFLQYDENPRAALRSYCADYVLYVGSFAKILAPSLRVGWIVLPQGASLPLSVLKESSDINTSTFSQRVLRHYCDDNHLETHIRSLCWNYQVKRDSMMAAIDLHFHQEAKIDMSRAGLFLWMQLPDAVSATRMLEFSLRSATVAFVPGSAFRVQWSAQDNYLRLNFSRVSFPEIGEGIKRLALAYRLVLDNTKAVG